MSQNKIKNVNCISEGKFISLYDLEYLNKKNQNKHWTVATRKNKSDLEDFYLNSKEDKVDAVAIVAYHVTYKKLVIIKQFRVPINDYIYEVPAGLVDEDDSDVFTAVERELKEETGLRLISVNKTLSKDKTYISPGLTDESVAIVNCLCDGELSEEFLEESEDIKAILVSQKEAKEIINSNEKIDIKAFLILQMFCVMGEKMFTE